MPSEMSKKALDQGLITKKQYNNLPPALLEAVAKKKLQMAGKGGKSYSDPAGKVRKGKRRKKGKGKK